MSKLLQVLTLVIAATFFSTAFAQTATDVQAQAQAFMQELQAKVNLTPEQKDQMDKIMTDSISQRENVIKSHQGQKGMKAKKEIRDELQPINDNTQAEVKKVLTEDQYKAFQDVQAARQEQLRARINGEF